MPTAKIIFQQNGDGYSIPTSRDDLALNLPITILNQDDTGIVSWSWIMVDKPTASTATIASPTASTTTFTPDIVGTYLVHLSINAGNAVDQKGAGIKTINFKYRIPAASETIEFDGYRGWATATNKALKAIDDGYIPAVSVTPGTKNGLTFDAYGRITATPTDHITADGYTIDLSGGASTNQVLKYNGTSFIANTISSDVSSVSNSDSTLTISPTTGAVIASLNLGHANIWSAQQTFSSHIIVDGYTINASGGATTNQILIYNGTSFIPSDIPATYVTNTMLLHSSISFSSSDSSLTAGASTSLGGTEDIVLNLSHSNTWSAQQTFSSHVVVDGYAINISGGATTNQVLQYNGTSFIAATLSSGSTLQQDYTSGGSGGGAITLTSTGGALALDYPSLSSAQTNGFLLQNSTVTTGNPQVQYSPTLRMQGHAWSTTAAADRNARFDTQVVTRAGNSSAVRGSLITKYSEDTGTPSWTPMFAIQTNGQIIVPYVGGSIDTPELGIGSGGGTLPYLCTTGFYCSASVGFLGVALNSSTYGFMFGTPGSTGAGFGPTSSGTTKCFYGWDNSNSIAFLNTPNLTPLDVRGQLGANGAGTDLILGALNGSRTAGRIIDFKDGSTVLGSITRYGGQVWTLRQDPGGNNATGTEVIDIDFNTSATRTWAVGALTTQRAALFRAPTYAFASASTLTNAATVAITGAPVQGSLATITNTMALWVQGGAVNLADGYVSQLTDINTGVTINGASGVITTQTATTAARAIETGFTVTNSAVLAGSIVVAKISDYSGTFFTNGVPDVAVSTIAGGSFILKIMNTDAITALNGTMKIHFHVL